MFRLNDFLTPDGLEYILRSEEIEEASRFETISKDCINEYQTIKRGFFLKYKGLNQKISDLLNDYSSVSLVPFDLTDKRYMAYVVSLADKATGFNFSGLYSDLEKKIDYDSLLEYMCLEAADDLQERYLDKDEY